MRPKTKRNLQRILPFAIIWVLSGWIVIITEVSVTRNQNLNPETDISFTLPVLIFANVANFILGCIVGVLEVIYFEKRFKKYSLKVKFFYKFLIYLILFNLVVVIFYPIAFSFETGIGLFQEEAWLKLGKFLVSYTYFTTLFHLSVALFICLSYAAVSENLGHRVVLNLLSGKYHTPQEENRIFLFLDLKSSTTIAEQLGHQRYFRFLQAYYDALSDAIIHHRGEVYQYIGDEIVITWPYEVGIEHNSCLQCFFAMQEDLNNKKVSFEEEFGVYPTFKGGMHAGSVTTGQIGALKKEVFYTGDVLNTASRIQSLCKEYGVDFIISENIKQGVSDNELQFTHIGETHFRGKKQSVPLYSVAKN